MGRRQVDIAFAVQTGIELAGRVLFAQSLLHQLYTLACQPVGLYGQLGVVALLVEPEAERHGGRRGVVGAKAVLHLRGRKVVARNGHQLAGEGRVGVRWVGRFPIEGIDDVREAQQHLGIAGFGPAEGGGLAPGNVGCGEVGEQVELLVVSYQPLNIDRAEPGIVRLGREEGKRVIVAPQLALGLRHGQQAQPFVAVGRAGIRRPGLVEAEGRLPVSQPLVDAFMEILDYEPN